MSTFVVMLVLLFIQIVVVTKKQGIGRDVGRYWGERRGPLMTRRNTGYLTESKRFENIFTLVFYKCIKVFLRRRLK